MVASSDRATVKRARFAFTVPPLGLEDLRRPPATGRSSRGKIPGFASPSRDGFALDGGPRGADVAPTRTVGDRRPGRHAPVVPVRLFGRVSAGAHHRPRRTRKERPEGRSDQTCRGSEVTRFGWFPGVGGGPSAGRRRGDAVRPRHGRTSVRQCHFIPAPSVRAMLASSDRAMVKRARFAFTTPPHGSSGALGHRQPGGLPEGRSLALRPRLTTGLPWTVVHREASIAPSSTLGAAGRWDHPPVVPAAGPGRVSAATHQRA